MNDVFKKNPSLHQPHTRYLDESKLSIPHRKHDYGKNCLSYRGATIWNSLEISIKEAKSCNTFKHLVKARFFRNLKLKEENIYIFWLLFFYCCSVKIIGFNVTFLLFCLLYANSFWRGPLWKYTIISVLRGPFSVIPVILIYPLAFIVCFMYLRVSMYFLLFF